jgi:hypothetical protein
VLFSFKFSFQPPSFFRVKIPFELEKESKMQLEKVVLQRASEAFYQIEMNILAVGAQRLSKRRLFPIDYCTQIHQRSIFPLLMNYCILSVRTFFFPFSVELDTRLQPSQHNALNSAFLWTNPKKTFLLQPFFFKSNR